ncbi:MAG: His/Gly/Thr/Pro-type tRNA ligase C-terminal domain-containing protein, partial [Promethearchaeota archaeon]
EIFEQCGVKELVEFDMSLARGLDYYTGPVFEIAFLGKPQVGSIGAGGRYDNLIEKFGGSPTPATGISLGVDRLVDILMPREKIEDLELTLDVFIAPINREMVKLAMDLQTRFVREGLSCESDLMEKPLKKLLDIADSKTTRFVVIVGPRDLEKGVISLRDMSSKATRQVKYDNVVDEVLRAL